MNTTKPTIQILTGNVFLDILVLFSHYLIAFPVFVLCWFALIRFLRRKGHITQREAHEMMDELKNINIPMPKRGPVMLAGREMIV